MIQLHNVSLAFGGQQVLDEVTWSVRPGQRIGLVGPNGAGKSTILRVINGRQPIDAGTVAIPGNISVGYLEQDIQEMATEKPVVEVAMEAFSEALALIEDEHRITGELEAESDHESDRYFRLLNQLERVHTEMLSMDVHTMRPRTEAVLAGLGFEADELERPIATFSGGWRMRVALARLLLRRPDYLLLDEPTNHLDIESIAWLETYLQKYDGTVVIVSHDRYFLDRMCTTTVELVNGQLTEYSGNYTFYLEERQERRILQQSAYDNQKKMIADTERFIERFRAKATKATQVQSRVKQLDKLERVAPPPNEAASIGFRFPEPPRSGRHVMQISTFSKTYVGDEGVVNVFDKAGPLEIERGDKIALIGKNGAGKSTLARMLRGSEPFEGTRSLGHNVEMTYFAQHQAESLHPNDSILDSLRADARGQGETQLRAIAGAFLFTGDDVFKPIGVLSGGERSRVALARTLLHPANFLILDEPTNHLDIQSINVLIEALKQYKGTFVIVSHDRHFLDQVVNKIWRVGDGEVRQFLGNYTEYKWQIEHGTAARFEAGDTTTQQVDKTPAAARIGGPKTKEQKRLEAEERARKRQDAPPSPAVHRNGDAGTKSDRQLRDLYTKVERQILKAEEHKKELETRMADPGLYNDAGKARQVTVEYEAIKNELAGLYRQWEEVAEAIS
jgi:ATP-binding cassette, subfamily F, member 3